MKKIYFVLMILVTLCTGCSVEYTLEINEDLSVNEKVVSLENQEFYDEYPKSTISRVIDLVMTTNKEYLDNNNYEVEKIIDKESGVNITNKFLNLDEYYKTSKFYTQLFSDFKYENNSGVVELNTDGLIMKETDLIEKYLIDEAKINIKLPFKVIENNADHYDVLTNTYSWDINDDMDYKKIYLKFDLNKKSIKYDKIFTYSIIGIMAIFIIIFIAWIVNKKNRNNEI